jgi:hypothetical protein
MRRATDRACRVAAFGIEGTGCYGADLLALPLSDPNGIS